MTITITYTKFRHTSTTNSNFQGTTRESKMKENPTSHDRGLTKLHSDQYIGIAIELPNPNL